MRSRQDCRIIFVTGTDTGVGKTVLTCLLLAHLRRAGDRALALKPFCSGGLADVRLLCALQDQALSVEEVNPFSFSEPVAPLVAARKHRRLVSITEVIKHIRVIADRCDWLLIEGAGGLLVPLGEDRKADSSEVAKPYTTLDLIRQLRCATIVVARNRLGTINHTLLTIRTLQNLLRAASPGSRREPRGATAAVPSLRTVLIQPRKRDSSAASNARILSELLAPVPLLEIPFLGPKRPTASSLKRHAARLRRVLGRLLAP